MDTKASLIAAALTFIENEGEAHFSTRAVCAAANVKAFHRWVGLLNRRRRYSGTLRTREP